MSFEQIQNHSELKSADFGKRHRVAVFISVGFMICFGMRANLSYVISISNFYDVSLRNKTLTETSKLGQLNWTIEIISLVDSSFFYGYILTQVPGGYLSIRYSATRVLSLSIIISALFNILLPLSTQYEWVLLIRIVQGLSEGVIYPACFGILRHWAPPQERGFLTLITYSGSYAGAATGLVISKISTEYLSWSVSFYVYGMIGILWYFFWFWHIFEKPSEDPNLSKHERLYIERSLGMVKKVRKETTEPIPWLVILKSKEVFAISFANACRTFAFAVLIITPKFIDQDNKTLIMDLISLSSMTVMSPFAGYLADLTIRSDKMSATKARKLFTCGGFLAMSIFMGLLVMLQNSWISSLPLVLACCSLSMASAGYNVNQFDLSPRYSPILMSISNIAGTIAGIIGPNLLQAIFTCEHRPIAIQLKLTEVAFLVTCVLFTGSVIYYGLASGEAQNWVETDGEDTQDLPRTESI